MTKQSAKRTVLYDSHDGPQLTLVYCGTNGHGPTETIAVLKGHIGPTRTDRVFKVGDRLWKVVGFGPTDSYVQRAIVEPA